MFQYSLNVQKYDLAFSLMNRYLTQQKVKLFIDEMTRGQGVSSELFHFHYSPEITAFLTAELQARSKASFSRFSAILNPGVFATDFSVILYRFLLKLGSHAQAAQTIFSSYIQLATII